MSGKLTKAQKKQHKETVHFRLGETIATEGAIEAVGFERCRELMMRHYVNDWGDLGKEDKDLNDRALAEGGRLFSCYIVGKEKFYVVTEHDRSKTTIMTADEY